MDERATAAACAFGPPRWWAAARAREGDEAESLLPWTGVRWCEALPIEAIVTCGSSRVETGAPVAVDATWPSLRRRAEATSASTERRHCSKLFHTQRCTCGSTHAW